MPDKLSAARAKIDLLDRRIAALLSRRFDLARPLAALKKTPRDPARERRVLANAAAGVKKPYAGAARRVFAEIVRQSVKLQKAKC